MPKKKLDSETKEKLKAFLERNVEAIIEAEIKTFKETEVSTHSPRVYIVTTLTMGLAGLNINSGRRPDEIIKSVVADYKLKERFNIPEDMIEIYNEHGSQVAAILSFLPGLMFTGSMEDSAPPDEQMLIKQLTNGTIRIEEVKSSPKYVHYRHLVSDVINVQVNTPFEDRMFVYKVIEHNDEVLDMPLFHTLDFRNKEEKNTGNMTNIKNLIEVEG
jgi:hypothetical protein